MKLPEAFTPKLVTAFREGYGAAELRADLIAGLTVAIIALPLAMALGIASGASPREGLVTAVLAGSQGVPRHDDPLRFPEEALSDEGGEARTTEAEEKAPPGEPLVHDHAVFSH